MNASSVIVAALTFRRRKGLSALLNAIELLKIPENTDVTVLIVDNSPDYAEGEYLSVRAKNFKHRLVAISEPERGIANARNRVLQYALQGNARYLLMIDDDEIPREDWMVNILAAMAKFGADVAIGSVEPIFEKLPPSWIKRGKFLAFGGHENGQQLSEGNTSNAAISMRFLRQCEVRFDREFDLTGGEDTLFFAQIHASGGRIIYAANAIVDELIVPHRASLAWLLQRWRRTGNTDARIRITTNPTWVFRVSILLNGLVRTIAGLLVALLGALIYPIRRNVMMFNGIRIFERGVGYVLAACRISINEYKNVRR